METKNYVVKNFKLFYDGIYKIEFKDEKMFVYLPINQICRLFEKEGYDIKSFDCEDWLGGIEFNKVEIIFQRFEDGGLITSEIGEDYQDNNIYFLEIEIE